jgi:hypothetical protein
VFFSQSGGALELSEMLNLSIARLLCVLIGGSLDIQEAGRTKVIKVEIPAATKQKDHLNLLLKLVYGDRCSTPTLSLINQTFTTVAGMEEDYD